MRTHDISCNWRIARGPGVDSWAFHKPEAPVDWAGGTWLCNCRDCLNARTPRIQLFTELPLRDWPHEAARLAVCATGEVVIGDPSTVLHADIMLAPNLIGEGQVMIAALLMFQHGWWDICYFQPFIPGSDERAQKLLSRLSTWTEFIKDAGRGVELLHEDERERRLQEDIRNSNPGVGARWRKS